MFGWLKRLFDGPQYPPPLLILKRPARREVKRALAGAIDKGCLVWTLDNLITVPVLETVEEVFQDASKKLNQYLRAHLVDYEVGTDRDCDNRAFSGVHFIDEAWREHRQYNGKQFPRWFMAGDFPNPHVVFGLLYAKSQDDIGFKIGEIMNGKIRDRKDGDKGVYIIVG